jgi:hypothetical protein
MSDVTITERQQYWLDHIRAAGLRRQPGRVRALGGSQAEGAVKEINWLLDGYPLTVTQANGSLPHHRVL